MGIGDVISVLAVDSRRENRRFPPRPTNNRRSVKVVGPGIRINGTRFGSYFLQSDEAEVFSYRTAIGLFTFVCIIVAITLKSYLFGS